MNVSETFGSDAPSAGPDSDGSGTAALLLRGRPRRRSPWGSRAGYFGPSHVTERFQRSGCDGPFAIVRCRSKNLSTTRNDRCPTARKADNPSNVGHNMIQASHTHEANGTDRALARLTPRHHGRPSRNAGYPINRLPVAALPFTARLGQHPSRAPMEAIQRGTWRLSLHHLHRPSGKS